MEPLQSPQEISLQEKAFFDKMLKRNNTIQETQHLVCISINKNSKKIPLYYTPLQYPLNYSQTKIFHTNDWSIQNFQIGRHLGRGRFGHVYLARQKKSKHIVALKVFSKKQIRTNQIFTQIRRQIQIHSHLKHQSILKMYGFFFDQKKIYCIMEYAANGELYNSLKKQHRFQEFKVRQIISQVISALKYLKNHKIIHRDIKPENILLDEDMKIKIGDFGWSIKSDSNFRKTFCGTYDYLCPEMIKNRPYDNSIDIWSLGILTYELACGRAPFTQSQRSKMAKSIVYSQPDYPPFFSESLIYFIGKCLQKVASDRITINQAQIHPWIKQKNNNDQIKVFN